MQSVISSLVAGLLLLQATTGWCCHRPCAESRAEGAAQPSNCCCKRPCEDAPSHEPTRPCQCDECLGCCTFVPPDKASSATMHVDIALEYVPSVSAIFTLNLSQPASGFGVSDSPPPRRSLRLHLLHQILVI
jgi:hypothetical protein